MTWTDRMKKTIETFKRMALPLFGFFLLFALVEGIIAVISLGAAFLPFFNMNGLGPSFSPAPYMNPNIPVPPGYGYGPSLGYAFGLEELAPFMHMLPRLLGGIAILMIVSMVLGSVFITGVFQLTKKAYTEKAQFRDIKLKGFPRLLGWYGIITFISIIAIGVGILVAMGFRSPYSMALFALIYMLALMAAGLFVAPWVSSAPFHMLNHREFTFGQAFKESWRFYRRHMGPLWGAFLTLLGIQLFINLINRNSPDIGLILTFIITPFVTILPIVWVLTLEEEELPTSGQETYNVERDAQPTSEPYNHEEPKLHESPSPKDDPSEKNSRATSSSSAPPYIPPKDPYSAHESPYQAPYTSSYGSTSSGEFEKEPINFCPTCGEKVREGASYCSKCGTKL
ncbi:zinc ribbon domain-containing protein [Desulfitobacterium sp. PCE1]|uniref:zinc ribbon domain-containing protein n=1 Tax=Desulfitobacterium sp. PCE1 TaxID=146907 RepID=UPI0003638AE0|nr:zinc ribbon domain-containing protein [Desulfitobacterium sp. PCE1]